TSIVSIFELIIGVFTMLLSLRSALPVIVLLGLVWAAIAAMAAARAGQPGGGRPGPGSLTPSRLRCEYRTDPLGVDVTSPRLSWIVEPPGRGQRQTAYQVLVAGDADTLGRDQGDLWDSGRVDSEETTAIVYAGRPLRSHQPCFWKVRVWDKD